MQDIPSQVLRASAGSGKTFALSNRYLILLMAGAPAQAILATTFTRQAAGEILERVLRRLTDAAQSPQATAKLARELHWKGELPHERCRQVLAQVAAQLHRVRVGTIDGFFQRVAQSFRWELGLPATPRLADDHDPAVMQCRAAALEAVLLEDSPDVLLGLLRRLHHDSAQRSVSAALEGIVGGLYDVYRQAPEQDKWQALTAPAPLSPAELADRLEEYRQATTTLQKPALAKAARKNLDDLQQRQWEAFLKNGLTPKIDEVDPTFSRTPIPPVLVECLRPLRDHAVAVLLQQARAQTLATHELLHRYDRHFTRLRRRQNLWLFSDVVHVLARDLPRVPELQTELYYRLDGRLQHLLLDEFQDTSLEQWEVFRPLVEEVVATGDESHSFFCVGDQKQAIYGWRGGCAELFGDVEQMVHPAAETSTGMPASSATATGAGGKTSGGGLHKSYRSAPAVLDVVNQVFTALVGNPALAGHEEQAQRWQGDFVEHTAAHRDLPGYVELVTTVPAGAAATTTAGTDDDAGDQTDDDDDGATALPDNHDNFVAQRLAAILQKAPGHSVGVLVNTNRKARQMLEALRLAQVEASGEGGNPITDDPAVNAVLAALWWADHPGDTLARHYVTHSPLGPVLHGDAADENMADPRRLRRELLTRGYAPVLTNWALALAPHCGERSMRRLTQLVELADRYEPDLALRPGRFVEYVRAARVEEPAPAAVRVMTIHRAKGLEFDIVVLAELERYLGRLAGSAVYTYRPSPTAPIQAVYRAVNDTVRACSRHDAPQLEEAYAQEAARRLQDDLCALYVAMTRARQALHMFVVPLKLTGKGQTGAKGWTNATAATLLRRGLVAGDTPREGYAGGETVYRHGNADWAGKVISHVGFGISNLKECDSTPQKLHRDTDHERPVPNPLREGTGVKEKSSIPPVPRRHWALVRPSGLEGDGRVRAGELLQVTPDPGRRYGTLMHAWLSLVEWGDVPAEALLRQKADELWPELRREEWRPLHATFIRMLQQPHLRAALQRPTPAVETGAGVTTTLWRERPFLVRDGARLLRGTFDRVVLQPDDSGGYQRAALLDFKTDHVPAGDHERRALVQHYRPQIDVYRRALSLMLRLLPEHVTASLAFMQADWLAPVT